MRLTSEKRDLVRLVDFYRRKLEETQRELCDLALAYAAARKAADPNWKP